MENKNLSSKIAEKIMITNIPVVSEKNTISEMDKFLLSHIKELETINYVYVVDSHHRLVGTLSIKDCFRLPKEILVSQVMNKKLVAAHPHTHQEQVALLAIRYNLKAIPIIDKQGKFLGIIPSDTILNILHNEAIEDDLRFAGIQNIEEPAKTIIKATAVELIKKRTPCLFIGLFGGIIAAWVVGFFETTLSQNLILVLFIPAVVYLSNAVGMQTETIFIRSLIIDHHFNLKKYLWREIKVGLAISLILGGIFFLLISIFWRSLSIGIVLGLSIPLTVLVAMAIAVFIPYFLNKINQDPAIASGPFATAICDIISLIIYFVIASLVLNLVF